MLDVAIIGCGIVGAAAAYELSRNHLSVAVFEKENDVAAGTTKANSAIIHAGYDPEPGTLMATLGAEGNRLAREICERLDVPHRSCGSLVLAFSKRELGVLESLLERGIQNGVPGLRLLGREDTLRLEPNVNGEVLGSLLAPSAMVVSPWEYALAMIETAVKNGAELYLERAVTGIEKTERGYRLLTEHGPVETRFVLNAAGVCADKIHGMVSAPSFKIIPDKGEYYLLDKSEGDRVGHVIFRCPTRLGKGTLVAPTIHGNLIVGPNNEPPNDCGDIATTSAGLAQVAAIAKISVPSIDFRASIRNFAGVRAASDSDDFIIAEAEGAPGFINLAGIKSPGLTAAPAIARLAARMLEERGLALNPKADFSDERRRVRFAELSAEEKSARIKKNPAYGKVICRCENVTEGEILDAFRSPVPPRSVDAVKRRCNSGMGRCQGGFCGPRIVEMLANELGINPTCVLQDKRGSFILTGETKGGGAYGI